MTTLLRAHNFHYLVPLLAPFHWDLADLKLYSMHRMKEHLGEMKPVSFKKEKKKREELTQIEGNVHFPTMSHMATLPMWHGWPYFCRVWGFKD